MAAIIAQMNRAKWERKKNKRKYIATNKSGLFIPPFDDGPFIPEKHNKYLRDHKKYLEKVKMQTQIREQIKVAISDKYGCDTSQIISKDLEDTSYEDLSSVILTEPKRQTNLTLRKIVTSIIGILAWIVLVIIFLYILFRAVQLHPQD